MALTVVILGFYGSKPRHVEKYATAWKSVVPSLKRCVLNECSGTLSFLSLGSFRDARTVVNDVKDEDQVVFHVLSNRGMLVYLEVVRLLPKNVKVAGVVFDSCPGALSPWLFFKATAANQKDANMKRLHEAMPYIIFLIFSYRYGFIRSMLVHIFLEFNARLWTRLYHFYVAEKDPARCPSLFLYSKTDDLVAYDLVEGCAAARERTVGNVTRRMWDQSAHVRHLYEHEEEYLEALRDFSRRFNE